MSAAVPVVSKQVGLGQGTVRHWAVQDQVDAGTRLGSRSWRLLLAQQNHGGVGIATLPAQPTTSPGARWKCVHWPSPALRARTIASARLATASLAKMLEM